MTTATTVRPDPRPLGLRILVWAGLVLVAATSVPALLIGLVDIDDPAGQLALCIGLVLAVLAVAGVARELAEHRVRRRGPEPRLEPVDGEPALFLPRDPAPVRIASWALLGIAAAVGLGAVLAATERAWGWVVVWALLAAYLVHLAAPHRTTRLAGGLWLTPTRLVHEHLGLRWQAPWEDVRGVVPRPQMPVLVAEDRLPRVERTGPRGRGWKPHRGQGLLAVDARHLTGGGTLAGYVITKSLAEPASRRVLGTPDSLPPQNVNLP